MSFVAGDGDGGHQRLSYVRWILWLWRYPRYARIERRRRLGLCYHCGYDVRGTIGVCRECGRSPYFPRTNRLIAQDETVSTQRKSV